VWLGESPWTLRLPALVWGAASIPALYYFGRQITHRREAFLATLFMVANCQHVWFSQNARGYTGLVLGALLTSSLFVQLVAGAGTFSR
jgi:mannosyltransferase